MLSLASADGVSWFESSSQPALSDSVALWSLASHGGDWVAAGFSREDGRIPVSWSANGLDWQIVAWLTDPFGREAFGYGAYLVSDGERLFLSAGIQAEGIESRPGGVWTSDDARTWQHLALGEEAEVRAVVRSDGAFLLGGRIGDSGADAMVWNASLSWLSGE